MQACAAALPLLRRWATRHSKAATRCVCCLRFAIRASLFIPACIFLATLQQEAIKAVQAEARAKFDESVELHMCLGIDPRRGDQVGVGVGVGVGDWRCKGVVLGA